MQSKEVTLDELKVLYLMARGTLDSIRQLDNYVLFTLGNPLELDEERGRIIQAMAHVGEVMREADKRLMERGAWK